MRATLWGAVCLLCVAGMASAQDDAGGVDVIPVEPLAEPEDEMVPLLPEVTWGFTGNVQVDALADSDAPTEQQNDAELRRARFSAVLEWKFDWRMKVGLDFAEDAPVRQLGTPLRELSFEYRGWPTHIEFGMFVEPFGMLQGGSRNSPLMERPQPSGLGPGYGAGIAANLRGESWGLTVGAFGPVPNDAFFGGREEAALTGRATAVPLRFDKGLVHVGLAGSHRLPVDQRVRFITIPETVLVRDFNTISTLLFTREYVMYGAELALQWGPVLLQGEYISAQIENASTSFGFFGPSGPRVSPDYSGRYVEVAWALTGEERDYSTRRGMFSGLYPERFLGEGGWGAFELAARRSETDLSDEGTGGYGEVTSAGLNWYPIEYVKLMLEGLQVRASQGDEERRTDVVQLRFQMHYTLP